jgi:Cu/Ag efflux protein CusF
MKFRTKLVVIFALLALAGCAAYEPGPLGISHPAHPEAVAAPQRPLSKTLAYTAADIPSTRPVLAAAVEEKGGASPKASGQEMVVGEGKVIATVPSANQIVVDHAEIKGFMEAMTMGYRIEPVSLLDGLKFGDKVRFTIDVQKKAIVKIEKMK